MRSTALRHASDVGCPLRTFAGRPFRKAVGAMAGVLSMAGYAWWCPNCRSINFTESCPAYHGEVKTCCTCERSQLVAAPTTAQGVRPANVNQLVQPAISPTCTDHKCFDCGFIRGGRLCLRYTSKAKQQASAQ